jgi:hypothetical protein
VTHAASAAVLEYVGATKPSGGDATEPTLVKHEATVSNNDEMHAASAAVCEFVSLWVREWV